jgi:hypothetical protein
MVTEDTLYTVQLPGAGYNAAYQETYVVRHKRKNIGTLNLR